MSNNDANKYIQKILSNVCYSGLATCVISFFWEHVARQNGSNIKPSIGMIMAGEFLSPKFEWIGTQLGKMSAYLTYIDFKEFQQTFGDLFEGMTKIFASPLSTLIGYYNYSKQYGNWKIYLGSIFLVFSMYFTLHSYKYGNTTLNRFFPKLFKQN